MFVLEIFTFDYTFQQQIVGLAMHTPTVEGMTAQNHQTRFSSREK